MVSVRIGLRPDRWHIATLAGCGAQLSRLWSQRRLCAGVGVTHGGWTNAQPLEVHGPWFSNACTDLQRMYPTLTPAVPARDSRPGSTPDLHARPVSPTRDIEVSNLQQVRPLGAGTAGTSVRKQAYKARNAPPSIVINEPVM